MAQIRKGFIASNAIDGTKLKLLNNDAIRAANADGTDAELMKLDASNVLQFLKLPQVSSDPSVANDLARKSYVDNKVDTAKGDVDAALAAETSARQSADAGLQSAIDTEKGRIDAILTAATADADSFAEIVNLINSVDTTNDQAFASYVLSNDAALASETSSRQSADSTLQSNIDAEASARAAAVSAEQSARESADSALQSNIDSETASRQSADSALQDGLDQEVSDRQAAVSAEQAAREAADSDLQSSLDQEVADRTAAVSSVQAAVDQEVADRTAAVSAESSARQSADATLQSNIDTEKARIDAILTAATADADSFAEIVNLINSVDTENDNAFASYVLSNDAALAQEVSDRQAAVSAEQSAREAADSAESAARSAADQDLQDQIDALDSGSTAGLTQEIADRTAADAELASDIADEASARQSADTTLQSNIDNEVSARQAAVSAEQAAREAADSALDVRVDSLEAVTHQKAKFTLTYMDIMSGYVELAHTVISNSEMVFVGSLYLHDGDHYTTSAGMSGTRLTWTGDVANGGASQLVEGDTVYVRYQASTGGSGGGGGGGGGEPGSQSFIFASFGPALGEVNWMTQGTTTEHVRLEYDMAGFWLNVANLGPADTGISFVTQPLNNGGTYRLVITDASGVTVVGSPSSTFVYTAAGGGGGGGGGPVFYSFPMIIGQTDNGDGTTTIDWSGANLPAMGAEVKIERVIGPAMYDSANGISLTWTPSTSHTINRTYFQAGESYALRCYEAGVVTATSASFQILGF